MARLFRKSRKSLNVELYNACGWMGDLKHVQDLLQDGADPLWKNPSLFGMTSLHHAASYGKTDIAKYLLDNTRLCEQVDILNDNSWTPCHCAAMKGQLEMTKLLINYGANRHRRDKRGRTPLDIARLNGCHDVVDYLVALGDSVQSPPNSSTSQDGVETTPQISVHSDTHHLSSDIRTADHSSSFLSLREQTPHKPSGLTGTPTQNTISQIMTKNYVDLHRVMSIKPDNMVVHLYWADLIGDSTFSYVTTATGVSHQTVAHRLVQECKAIIISHDDPIERMRKLLEILSDEPSGKTLADRISEQYLLYSTSTSLPDTSN